jgi:hypothetical protein
MGLFLLISLLSFSQKNWELVKETDGITVSSKTIDGFQYPALQAKKKISATSTEQLLQLLTDYKKRRCGFLIASP